MSGDHTPLILTADLPSELHRHFTELRRAHYPPERNYLEAHVTLFHALPSMCEDELMGFLSRMCGEFAPPRGCVEGVMSLGQGTAILLSSGELLDVRSLIADHFRGMLTMQDSGTPRLHVTIQNKVTTAKARALQSRLEGAISCASFTFPALSLHRYRNGPWEFVRRWPFRGK